MTFVSIEYVIFLVATFLCHWIFCGRTKDQQNMLIAISSLVFYGWWDWRFLLLLLVTAFSTFAAGAWMKRADEDGRKRRLILWGTIALNVGILFFFKYYNFFVESFVDMFRLFGKDLSMSTLKIVLPVGISFYTFSALSYSIDVYQRKVVASKDALAYLAYVMFFPSILSGPISRAQKQLPQYFQKRDFDYGKAVSACKVFLWGAVMKTCLADRLGIYVDAVYGHLAQHNGTTLLVTSFLYSLQIYADFAGYSLMAIGSGRLFGLELQANFVRPYFAKTVTEFWRRWHMSLTTWFRDYIYFPLGGNRVSKSRWMLNTMIVFVVSGLWHGAAYTFLIWGGLHGVCMIAERLFYGSRLKQIKDGFSLVNAARILLTFCVVTFAWIFFRAESIKDALLVIGKIFMNPGRPFLDVNTLSMAFFALALVFFHDSFSEYGVRIKLLNSRHMAVKYVTVVLLICYVLVFGVLNGGSFIYFQF